ncbi:type-F conjugative transfer system pilin chaperone TraQ [Edwardsiella tarda]|uniref:Conjugal transfer protein TraQ n=2 Tax=Edwardsiella TaxID=635 RepID=A0A2S1PMN7_EDWTA|nr:MULTISPECIES: type-F conjugative transfer system pilin chaperone TraQ [Edwardsiella]ATI65992.1 conjugal transfer protein TraQ [Edwardsiella tarda]AWH59712.1 conjugal transfer protein TraQ [Edwardsiella tarda]ELM3737393.1 type-F conjugative transfer system pilin chaperone TraQ [Edwardsiella piscicida]UJT80795.1 type-F conjugative transfer system pilin chaperone TraQ [Edwardsiella piscicida]WGE31129.1 type-F conjugative transfer system pilin chaperone TraQ [Edwardsiella tarda]
MRKFRFPDIDITGMWVVAVGAWFHIVARLVRKQPVMAIQLAELIAVVMVIVGGYKILNKWLADIERKERQHDENGDA